MKNFILALFLMISTFMPKTFADQLPSSWYGTEAGTQFKDNVPLEGTNSLFEAASNAVHTTDSHFKSLGSWGVYGFVTTLAVTASGKLGIVGSKGSAAVEIFWRKIQKNKTLGPSIEENNEGDFQVALTDLDDEESLEAQIDDSMKMLKTKIKFENESVARAQLKGHLGKFREMAKAAMSIDDRACAFYLSSLRLDLSVAASGTITPVVGAGAATQLRIMWTRLKSKSENGKSNSPVTDLTASGKNFVKVVHSVMDELTNLPDKNVTKAGLSLKSIRIGLGTNLAGNIAVAKVNGGFVFNVFLNKNPNAKSLETEKHKVLRLPFLAEVADKNGAMVETALLPGQLNKGIRKAMKISERFVARALRGENRHFEPYQVENIFSLSSGAGVGLVTLNGVAQLQLFYKK